MPPPPTPALPISEERRKFLAALLDICVRQLAWPDDADWEPPGGEDPDPEDDMAKFWQMRMVGDLRYLADPQLCSVHIESIAALDKSLHTDVVANIVASTLNSLQSGGPSVVSWQQAELAMHLVYTFGELNKSESWDAKRYMRRANEQTTLSPHFSNFRQTWAPSPAGIDNGASASTRPISTLKCHLADLPRSTVRPRTPWLSLFPACITEVRKIESTTPCSRSRLSANC